MEAVFLKILNMSLTASVIIAAVLIVRALLRKAPKKYSYWLWSVVGFRLACPVSWQSVYSLFSLRPPRAAPAQSVETVAGPVAGTSAIEYIPRDIGMMAQPRVNVGIPAVSEAVSQSLPAATPETGMNPMQFWTFMGALVWLIGVAALLVYAIVSYVKLRRGMDTAVRLEGNVYESDRVRSPFILGFLRPKIYIPFGLEGDTLRYVLEHERYHIRRGDYLVKSFAFLLLCVHWFNPLAWLSFWLMGRDMEMSCDEKVLSGERGSAKAYSMALLGFAANRRFPAPSPLAFGETDVKSRIKNALNWKKPKTWVTLAAAVIVLASVAAFAANPENGPSNRWLKNNAWGLAGGNAQYAGVTVEKNRVEIERGADGTEIKVCYPITGEMYHTDVGIEIQNVQNPVSVDNPRYVVTYEFLPDNLSEPDRVTVGTLEGSTPWVWTHTVRAEQLDGGVQTDIWPEDSEFALTRTQLAALTALLNNVRRDEVHPGRGYPEQRVVTLQCGEETYRLSYDGNFVVLSFDEATAARYPIDPEQPAPVWEIHNDALYAFLDGLAEGIVPANVTLDGASEERSPVSGWLYGDGAVLDFVMEHYEIDGSRITGGTYQETGAQNGADYKKYMVETEGGAYSLTVQGELRVHRFLLWKTRIGPEMRVTGISYTPIGGENDAGPGEPAPANAAPQSDAYADQIALIAANRDTWRVLDESDGWGYAVTDLDRNGRLEIIATETHGSGHFSADRIFEVSADGRSLVPVLVTELAEGVEMLSQTVPVYYDFAASANLYHYVFKSTVKYGASRYEETLTDLTLSGGAVTWTPIAYKETVYNLNDNPYGSPTITCTLPDGTVITEEDYELAARRVFSNCQQGTMYFAWIRDVHLDDLDADSLLARLTYSYENSYVSFDGEPFLTVASGGVSLAAHPALLYTETWAGDGWVVADGVPWQSAVREHPEQIPTLTLGEDFGTYFGGGAIRMNNLKVYAEDLTPLREYMDGNSAVNWLEPGTYYCVIGVHGPRGKYVESEDRYEQSAYNCVFRLTVTEGSPAAYAPAEAHDLTEARLNIRGEDVVLTDAASLAKLESWLGNATELPGGAACPFGSILYLTRSDGNVFSLCPAEDGCGAVLAGEKYYRYASGNEEFWAMFTAIWKN